MAIIVPAILEDTPEKLNDKITELLKIPNVEKLQIDISDGVFSPRKTVQIADIDILNPAYEWQAHLMVSDPSAYVLDVQIAGFSSVVVSFEAFQAKAQLFAIARKLKSLNVKSGLCINPLTPITQIIEYIPIFDEILLLAVTPGYQGQEFDRGVIEKIKTLRKDYKNVNIGVDGGIKHGNVKDIATAGADFLIIGSGLYAEDPNQKRDLFQSVVSENFEQFQKEIQNS